MMNASPDTKTDRFLSSAIYGIGVLLTLFTIYYAYEYPMSRLRYSNIFLGTGLTLFYLLQIRSTVSNETGSSARSTDDGETQSWVTVPSSVRSLVQRLNPFVYGLLALASVFAAGYVEFHFTRLQEEASILGWTQLDLIVGGLIIYLVIDATWRAYGKSIGLVVVSSVFYAFAGPWFPGIFRHTGMSWEQISREGAIGLSGAYGFIFGVGTTWVAIFIMFAGMAKAYGLMDFITQISREVRKVFHSGVVHVAVLGSMAMGSITGSAAANTATTGSFTIPMMKDQGVRPDYAAAIESVASSGGQMMPPVMGVAAFLMADILGVSYLTVIQAGLIPALLFYFSVLVAVHLVILRFGWTVPERGTFDRSVIAEGIHFSVPLFVLIYTLVVLELTPLGAGLYTIISLVVTMYLRNFVVDGLESGTAVATTKQTIDGFRQGAVDMAPLVGMLASLGVVLGLVNQTGLSQKISTQMLDLAAGIFILLLVLSMVTSVLFGLGMPTPAAYILVVILVAPSMVSFGVDQLTAHMFVFYFAMLSAITPPVAVAVAIGSQISGASFTAACKQALRIGAPGFVIPYSFIANQSLISWSFPETIVAVVFVFTGVVALSVATIGYDGGERIGLPRRAIYLVLSALAIAGPLVVQIAATAGILSLLAVANSAVSSSAQRVLAE
ncbi:C4-dicarboxylate ABC transporter permease [Natrinema sp. CBA1119]|uniref:TRAP transporter permease n=1 Tax=Natrinema sp. CBA1119 TaxID=1608465 RepID=UPI000BF29A8A|nr:C4-dicarboxylate ABC transporter permease [Natrinema sp. CBA1119]